MYDILYYLAAKFIRHDRMWICYATVYCIVLQQYTCVG